MSWDRDRRQDSTLDGPSGDDSPWPGKGSSASRSRGSSEWPGKRSVTGSMQRKHKGQGGRVTSAAEVHDVAEQGVSGASSPLPHLDTIQRSFGHHDLSGVTANVGGDHSSQIGASAYAMGDRVNFASSPDLHTSAHEAAHVVQQRRGVSLFSGIGEAGDIHERHADRVADAVVAGQSAQSLLDGGSSSSGSGGSTAVQRKGAAENFVPTSFDSDKVPGANSAQHWMRMWGNVLIPKLGQYLASTSFAMPSPHADWKDMAEFARATWKPIAAVGVGMIYAELDKVMAPDRLEPHLNAGRDAPTQGTTNPMTDDPIDAKGTPFWMEGVVADIGKMLVKRVIESLERMLPRWLEVRNQLQLSSVGPVKTPDRDPKKGELIASHPMDTYVAAGLESHVTMNYKSYRAAHPEANTLGDMRFGELRKVTFEWMHDQATPNWIRVTSPANPTKEEVAKALYGDETYAHTLTAATPLFGFSDTDNLSEDIRTQFWNKTDTAKKPPRQGDDDEIDAPEQQVQGADNVTDEIMLAQAATVKASAIQADEGGRHVILDRMNGAHQLYQQIFNVSKTMPAGGYSNLLEAADGRVVARAQKVADPNMSMNLIIPWDGQTQAQNDYLLKALNGITMAVKQYETFKGWDSSATATQQVGWMYLKVACLSEQATAAGEAYAAAEQASKLFPVTVMEMLLAEIRKVLHKEGGAKFTGDGNKGESDANHDARTDFVDHTQREAKLREGLARVRDKLLQNQDGAGEDLKKLAQELTDLQNEVSIVADIDAMDVAWKAVYDDISFIGAITTTNSDDVDAVNNSKNGLRLLKGQWEAIYARYKSGDKKGAIEDLKAKRPTWTKAYEDIRKMIKDNETLNKWVTFGILVGIAVITAGVGAYVEGLAAATWGAASWTTLIVTSGAEAAVFTTLSYALVEKDPTIGGFFLELGKNFVMFMGLKLITAKYIAMVGKEAAGTVDTMIVQFVAVNTAALVEADAKKYLSTGQHLTMDEVLEISKQNAMFMVAAGFATMAATPGIEAMKLTGEADAKLAQLRGVKTELKALADELQASKNVDIAKGQELLVKQREMLKLEEEALQHLEKLAKDPAAAKKAGLDVEKLGDMRKAHDEAVKAAKAVTVLALTEGTGAVRWASKGAAYDEVCNWWRGQEGAKVVELRSDSTFGARGVEITSKEGETFRLLERTGGPDDVVAKSPQFAKAPPTPEQVEANKAAAVEAGKAIEESIAKLKPKVDSMKVREFKRIQVGGDAAGLFNQASMPKSGGGGPAEGEIPDFLTITDKTESWRERGPVNQMPGEVDGPGLDASGQTTKQHDYVSPTDLSDAILIGKKSSGMSIYRGRAVGSIETKGAHDGAAWESPNKQFRIQIDVDGQLRYFYADAIDLATGPGPSKEIADGAVVGKKSGQAYQDMTSDGRLFYGDQAPTRVLKPGGKVVVWGGSGNGAAMAEAFAEAGCDVTWVARVSAKDPPPGLKPEIAELRKELEDKGLSKEARTELQAKLDDLLAFGRARLPRNVKYAFESETAKAKIKRVISDVTDIDSAVDKDNNKQVKLKIGGAEVVVDQLVVSQGQDQAAPGAAGSLAKNLQFEMILDGNGRVVGLESVNPPGVRLMGAAFADPKMADYVIKSQREDFIKKLTDDSAGLPDNSNGVAPSLANSARNIQAANDVLAARDYKLPGESQTLILQKGSEQQWPAKVQAFLAGELGVDPGRLRVDPVTDGKSGAPVYRVRIGNEELGYFKVFNDPAQAAVEIKMLKLLASKDLKNMNVVGDKGTIGVEDGAGAKKTGLMMSTADGTSVDGMIKNLPEPSSPDRASMIAKLREACVKVAKGLGEMHAKFADGSEQTTAQKQKDADYIVRKLDGIKDKLGQKHYERVKQLLTDKVVPEYLKSKVKATIYHGDANVGNFIINGKGELSTIDVGNMQYSVDASGKPTGTGAADVARFLESLETKRPGALTPAEVKSLTDAFNEAYFKELGTTVDPKDLEAATLLYRAELEMAVIRASSPDATDIADTSPVVAIDRLDSVLGIPPTEFPAVVPTPPTTTNPDDDKKKKANP